MDNEDILKEYEVEITYRPSLKARYRLARRAYGDQDARGWRIFIGCMFACLVLEIAFHIHFVVPYWVSYGGWFAVFFGSFLVSGAQRLQNQSAARFGNPGKLAVEGIYAYSRNPMYIGFVLIPFGLGLAQDLFWFLMMSVPMVFIFQYYTIPSEEKRFLNKWGSIYSDYMTRTPRWL